MKKFLKIPSILFLLISLALVFYLSVSLEDKAPKIGVIELNGNFHLSKDIYFKYAGFEDKEKYNELTLPLIKDRLEKHPYIKRADVIYEGDNAVTVQITEKVFEALLYWESKQFIITEDLETLPILSYTKRIDYPVISNPFVKDSIRNFHNVKKYDDVVTALKILTTAKLTDPELYENLNEINLRNGGDILLYYSFADYPVVVGRGNEIAKVIYFGKLWNNMKGKSINRVIEYIDLRFAQHVYLGITTEAQEDKEVNS
ncbi:MAG: FtsQ-type POTRA domain-containing protein [Melioribacteraceae bacterium]|nr:FtsQ-type POTRA domain-containing protein [Melioribacteraceae bacterium]